MSKWLTCEGVCCGAVARRWCRTACMQTCFGTHSASLPEALGESHALKLPSCQGKYLWPRVVP